MHYVVKKILIEMLCTGTGKQVGCGYDVLNPPVNILHTLSAYTTHNPHDEIDKLRQCCVTEIPSD